MKSPREFLPPFGLPAVATQQLLEKADRGQGVFVAGGLGFRRSEPSRNGGSTLLTQTKINPRSQPDGAFKMSVLVFLFFFGGGQFLTNGFLSKIP